MRCCDNCFVESQIRDIIISQGVAGKCELCGKNRDKTIELNANSPIIYIIHQILDVYSVVPIDFPKKLQGRIAQIIHDKWNIFSPHVSKIKIFNLLKELFPSEESAKPGFFSKNVGISEHNTPGYLKDHSILKDGLWSDFVSQIITKNRFHTTLIKCDILKEYLRCLVKELPASYDKIFYRGRISKCQLTQDQMGPPPASSASSGRINPEGISVLYLANNLNTTLYEVRAMKYQTVCIGEFKLQSPIKIIDLSSINQISPFDENGDLIKDYPLNIEFLREISKDLLRPISSENHLEYLPIQYICDFIKSLGYDGVEYHSTMDKGGRNFAIFTTNAFKCIKTYQINIKNILYKV